MTGKIRIIGGFWRGRRLDVLDLPGLRPSGDRSRETLFNWLGPSIQGCDCLDLFAGSGALGLEAISRGASSACLVEKSSAASVHLKAQISSWDHSERVKIINASAFGLLARASGQYDLVFIDPPHGQELQMESLVRLVEQQKLRSNARVYVEYGLKEEWMGERAEWLDREFDLIKQGRFGQVGVSLFRVSAL